MQPDVHPHVILDLHCDLGRRPMVTLVIPFGLLRALYVRPDHVFAGGHQLLKLTHVIGIDLPARFLISSATYFDAHSVHWLVLGIPHRAEDQSIMALLGSLVAGKGCRAGWLGRWHQGKEQCQHKRSAAHVAISSWLS